VEIVGNLGGASTGAE